MSPGKQLSAGVQKAPKNQAPVGLCRELLGGPSCPFSPGSVPGPGSPCRCGVSKCA